MRRILIIGSALLAFLSPAIAADSNLPPMTAASALADTDLMYCGQSVGTLDRKCTPLQVSAYVFGKVSGSLSCTGTGTCTVTTNANLTGDVTSSGNATTLTNAPVIAKVLTGFTSGAGTVSAADSILSALQKINGNVALNAPLASPAFTGTPTAPTATVGTNTTQLATTAFVLANAASGSGTVTSVSAGCGTSTGGSPITTTGTVGASLTNRAVTGTTDTILAADCGNIITYNSASAVAAIQPAPSGSFAAGFFVQVCNKNSGPVTFTPGSGTIYGGSTFVLPAGSATAPSCAAWQSDGTNFNPLVGGIIPGTIVPNVVGSGRTVSGTTDTLAATDCGTEVDYTNSGAVTVTIPATLPARCVIAIAQLGAGKVSVNGSAVTPATLHTHVASGAATGTAGQYAVINVDVYSNSGGSSAIALLTGDGA